MYRIFLNEQIKNKKDIEELVKIFLIPDDFIIYDEKKEIGEDYQGDIIIEVPLIRDEDFKENSKRKTKNIIKGILYDELSKHTGIYPDWGIITGIRPVKLTKELLDREGSLEKVREILLKEYRLTEEKADLLLQLSQYQLEILKESPTNQVGIYIGIPFCPTRCTYCSFTSNQVKDQDIKGYLKALHKEIDFVAGKMKAKGLYPESIYLGGGTPTTLMAEDLRSLLHHIRFSFDLSFLKEFTVEAGRPDTISREKLAIMKDMGVGRISINPQSMKAETLSLIGRAHSIEEIIKSFKLARETGIPIINADIIAGLPEENEVDFKSTLETLINLKPDNITVHTLALKRASKLKEIDSQYHYHQGNIVREMLEISKDMLYQAGYIPYYLYRQKQMIGNFENLGYALKGTEGIYNIRIMDEKQTIIALGAGGISKVYYGEENRLERVANVSNYQIYMERLEEMLQRKEENIFKEDKLC